MKKNIFGAGVFLCVVCFVASGCKPGENDFQCDDTTIAFCDCDDGSQGRQECVDGELGACVCEPPENSGPCAVMINDTLSDNMTRVAECSDGEYVECMIQPVTINGVPSESILCEKIFESGLVLQMWYPFIEPEELDCFLLNINCCNSDAQECIPLVELGAADNGTSVEVGGTAALAVTLESNPSTGYAWEGPVLTGDDIIGPVRQEYIPDEVAAGIVGSGGREQFFFFADAVGEADLAWQYVRSGTGNAPADKYGFTLISTEN